MEYFKIILVASLALTGISCGSKKTEMFSDLVYDSLSVKVDYPYLSDYASPRPFYRNDTLYVCAYNHLIHYSGAKHCFDQGGSIGSRKRRWAYGWYECQ